ncbi:DUF3331 domain-containing protein [Paraburkholderia dipogonis]
MQDEKADVKPLTAPVRRRPEAKNRKAAGQQEATSGSSHRLKITAIERHNDKSAFISWCDSTMGHYVDQLWIMMKAPSVGRCALTGQSIKKGDHVFRPSIRNRSLPANCNEMVLATTLSPEHLCP